MIHNNYNKITETEKDFIDEAISRFADLAKEYGIKTASDDRIEKVVEAMATCILESR